MKQKRLVSMIGALVLIISAVVLITGCPQSSGKVGGNSSTLKLLFDESKIECKRSGIVIKSGAEVADGELLIFDAKGIPDGKIAEWTVGTTVKKASPLFYYVKKNDADSSGVIKVKCEVKDAAKFKIIFNGTSIEARKNNVEIMSGAEVNEGDRIHFIIKNPTPNKVAVWAVNNKPASFDIHIASLNYYIKAEDADNEGKLKLHCFAMSVGEMC